MTEKKNFATQYHRPVLLDETLAALDIRPDSVYLDGTAGGGGHSKAIASRLTTGRLIALDQDPDAVREASRRLEGLPAVVVRSNFTAMDQVLEELGVKAVDGILLDIGVSSHQLDAPERGFSYHHDAPLDMRMSKSAVPAAVRREGHPARQVFQALRIAVNGELDCLSAALDTAFDCLKEGGRLAVITFHSLEDRLVKQRFAAWRQGCVCPPDFPVCVCGRTPAAEPILRKPAQASPAELKENPRARSAKLRCVRRLHARYKD